MPLFHAPGRFDAEFLASRKIALERCLRRMVSHPVLHQSSDLKLFLEEDNLEAAVRGYPRIVGRCETCVRPLTRALRSILAAWPGARTAR